MCSFVYIREKWSRCCRRSDLQPRETDEVRYFALQTTKTIFLKTSDEPFDTVSAVPKRSPILNAHEEEALR